MYKSSYQSYTRDYKEPIDGNYKKRFMDGIDELSNDFIIFSKFPCRLQCFKFLRAFYQDKKNFNKQFIAYTEKILGNFDKEGNLIFPIHIYFNGDTKKIIKVFNEEGFIVLWSGDPKDVMMLASPANMNELSENNINYDLSEVDYELW